MQTASPYSYYDGIKANEFSKKTALPLEVLKNNDLIIITRDNEVYFTTKGKIAMNMGFKHYLKLSQKEKEFAIDGFKGISSEKKDISMIFGGMLVSLLLIVAFWVLNLEFL